MLRRFILPALASALLVGTAPGCDPPGATHGAPSAAPADEATAVPAEPAKGAIKLGVREGSVIARSEESDALYVADEDHATLRVLALPAAVLAARADVSLPGPPAQVLVVGSRVLVTIRALDTGEGALLVLRRTGGPALEEVGRVSLPSDAWGMALSPDARTALVSSAWTHRVSAVDLAALTVRWSVDVAREPRGIVVLPEGDRAYVSHLVGSQVTRLDGVGGAEPRVTRVALPASPMRSPEGVALPASLGYSAVASPSGDRVYFPRHALGALGPEAWFGAGAVDVLLTADDTPLAPPRGARPTTHLVDFVARDLEQQRWLYGTNIAIERDADVAEPRAVVYRKRTDTILIADEGSDQVTELDALAQDPTLSASRTYKVGRNYDATMHVPRHGAAPAGLVLSESEDEAYVFCRATYDVVVLPLPPAGGDYRAAPPLGIRLAEDPDKARATGRALFYKSDDRVLSGGLSCAACHPEGRDDGHVWHEAKLSFGDGSEDNRFTNFFGGSDLSSIQARWGAVSSEGDGGLGYARQTPMLAGRVAASGPYGWHADSPDLPSRIRAGFGLHRWARSYESHTLERAYADALAVFLREGLAPPPRPARPLTADEQRGKELFESPATQCSTCHAPASGYTNRAAVPLKKWKAPAGFAEDPNPAFKTPSLLFVGGTPPYMHDGRFASLEALIEHNQDHMGKTSQLSPADRGALVAFLRTL